MRSRRIRSSQGSPGACPTRARAAGPCSRRWRRACPCRSSARRSSSDSTLAERPRSRISSCPRCAPSSVATSSCPPRPRNLDLALFASGQLGLWAAVYGAYLIVRALTIGARSDAVGHAREMVGAERALGIFREHSLQHALAPAITFFSAYYVVGFGPICVVVLVWLALRQRDRYVELRDALLVSLGLATIVFVLFPTAPPRLVPGLGITDTVGLSGHDTGSILNIRFNPYAAMPSMHVGWSVLVAVAGFRALPGRVTRSVFAVQPLLMVVAVSATGNHLFLDSVAGATVAAASIS